MSQLAHSEVPEIARARILIVDDEPRNVRLLERVLQAAGYTEVSSTTDATATVPLCRSLDPDLLILDLHMPGMDGFEVMREIDRTVACEKGYLPILVLTADATEGAKRMALAAGARDFLTKPFGVTETVLRIRNLLETRALYGRLRRHNERLAERITERTRELEMARLEVVERLCQVVEFRDDATGRHTRRVGERSAELARAYGFSVPQVDLIRRAAPLHDVGKIAIPDLILLKPGRLTPDEFAVMQNHTSVGARILAGGASDLMAMAETIAQSHHERWDGRGYPLGMAGEQIPVPARIVALVDVFDALTAPRSYREAWAPERALDEIRRGAGTHFDPELARVFLELPAPAPPVIPSATRDLQGEPWITADPSLRSG